MRPLRKTNVLVRAAQITRAAGRYFLFYRFGRHKNDSFGLRLRLACEELGLVFIKLGQILFTRYDLLEKSDCEALQKLLDEVAPMDYEAVEQIFIQDFGKRPTELYAEFLPQPIAAASIAQVYRGRLADGRPIAIKVKRYGVDHAIRSDMKIFKALARGTQAVSPTLRHINAVRIIEQLEDWLDAELDFGHEIKNMAAVNAYYQARMEQSDSQFAQMLSFPESYPELCSQNVIVMSFVEGVSVRSFRSVADHPNYDAGASLQNLLRAVLRAWLNEKDLFFHGDPHPSNLILLPYGRIALLDFGLMGHFETKNMEETRNLFFAVYAKNVEAATQIALSLSGASKELDTPALREDIRKYIEETRFAGVGFWFMGFIRVFVRHRIPIPYQLVLFGRCQIILEGVIESVIPGTSALDIIGEELRRGMRRQLIKNITTMDFAPALYALSEKVKTSPGLVAKLIEKYLDNPLGAIQHIRSAIWENK